MRRFTGAATDGARPAIRRRWTAGWVSTSPTSTPQSSRPAARSFLPSTGRPRIAGKASTIAWRSKPHEPVQPEPKETSMSDEATKLSGPDFADGVALAAIADGAMLLGHAQGEPVLLARRGSELFAIG